MMTASVLAQGGVAACYLLGAWFVSLSRETAGRVGIGVVVAGLLLHLSLLLDRWLEFGQLPIVTRYENISVDSLAVAAIYLLAQWRIPALRRCGLFLLPVAAIGTVAALAYPPHSFPWTPALRTNWLVIHATLNSLAIGAGTLAAAAIFVRSSIPAALRGRLLAWALFLWCAMIAAGSYWASLAWGRYWGWDPIESWALATALSYAFVLHLRLRANWREMQNRLLFGLLPYAMMMFTTYGLLMVRTSAHSRYLFQ